MYELVVFKEEGKKTEEDWDFLFVWSKREVVNWISNFGVTLESVGGWKKLI